MKRLTIAILAAVMLFTTLATPVLAFEQSRDKAGKEIFEGERHRPGRPGRPGPGRPGRPGHGWDGHRGGRDRDRDWVGFGVGAALGMALGALTNDSSSDYYYSAPGGSYYYQTPQYYQPQQTLVYDPSCNCYYYR